MREQAAAHHFLGGLSLPSASYTQAETRLTVLGSPIWRERLSHDFAQDVLEPETFDRTIAELNGSFLLILETGREVTVVNDRFASVPVFYAQRAGELAFGTSYLPLASWLRDHGELRLQEEAFYEFFHLQRLLGTRSYDRLSSVMEPATVLTFDAAQRDVRQRRYWRGDFTKSAATDSAMAVELAEALTASVRRMTSDGKRYGLLLSGGLDSRAVLAAFPVDAPPVCFTVGDGENNEFDVAAEVASAAGAKHALLRRSPDHYETIVGRAVTLGGGMYVFDHGHFLGLAAETVEAADVIFHGHGLDFLFRGMYLPAGYRHVMGRRTFLERLDPLRGSIADAYCSSVKYRLKGLDPLKLVLANRRGQAFDWLREGVESVMRPFETEVAEPHDLWDLFHTSNFSRHYTYLNVLSIADETEQRTVAFDNDLYDICRSMPVRMRLGGRVFNKALARLRPPFMEVRNANDNLRAGASPLRRTAAAAVHALARRAPLLRTKHFYPSPADRSWPDREELVRTKPGLAARARALGHSDVLGSLDLFDLSAIGHMVDDHLSGVRDAGAAVLTLITIDEFLHQALEGAPATMKLPRATP